MTKSLLDKRAMVLGVSSEHGMGYAIARQMIGAGASVMIAGRDLEKTRPLADSLGAEAACCDIRESDQLQSLADSAINGLGGLDIAVNCTGVPAPSSIARASEQEVRTAAEVMLLGTFFFLQKMAAAIGENGSIITLSSITASKAMTGNAAYTSAKAGADHLVRSAAVEFGPKQIRVNSVSPGFTDDTPMTREFLQVPGMRETFEKEIPLGRLNTPRDVANTVCWLCGDEAFLTGQNLQVNGGNDLLRMPTSGELAALYKRD
ncbi:MAG: SDR family oxidoreductase [Pseudomonadota bacterium]